MSGAFGKAALVTDSEVLSKDLKKFGKVWRARGSLRSGTAKEAANSTRPTCMAAATLFLHILLDALSNFFCWHKICVNPDMQNSKICTRVSPEFQGRELQVSDFCCPLSNYDVPISLAHGKYHQSSTPKAAAKQGSAWCSRYWYLPALILRVPFSKKTAMYTQDCTDVLKQTINERVIV